VVPAFNLGREIEGVLNLMRKYASVPMGLADGCLVRMTELVPDTILLTTDADFRIYRRNGRQIIRTRTPADF
jgi:hypothetical protein